MFKPQGADVWQANLTLAPHRYRRVRLHRDKAIAGTWERALQLALDTKGAGLPVKAEGLRGIPRKVLEGLELVNRLAGSRAATWEQLAAAYVKEIETAGRSELYVTSVTRRLLRVAKGCAWRTPADVTRQAWQRYAQARREAGRSPVTVNTELDAVKSFMKWLIMNEFIDKNPLQTCQPVAVGEKRRRRRAFTDDEVSRLLAVAGAQELLLRVAFGSGLRYKELKALEWRDVHTDGRPCLQLRAEATKARRADLLPLTPDLAARLVDARPAEAMPTDNVFTDLGGHKRWLAALDRAGIEYRDTEGRILGWHSTRVTFITNLGRANKPLKVVQSLARHRDPKLTMNVYSDVAAFDLWGAVGALPTYPVDGKVDGGGRCRPGSPSTEKRHGAIENAGVDGGDSGDGKKQTFKVDPAQTALATGTDGACAPVGALATIQGKRPSVPAVASCAAGNLNTAPAQTARIHSETEHFSPVALSEMHSGTSLSVGAKKQRA